MDRRRVRRNNEQARSPKPPDETDAPQLTFWVVAFLDLLGYKSVLEGIDVFPFPQEQRDLEHLQEMFVRAVNLRRRLIGLLQDYMARYDSLTASSQIPASGSAEVGEFFRNVKVLNVPGADHVVLGCSLAPSPDHFPMRAVYNVFGASALAMLLQLSLGADSPDETLPLRGGIDLAAGGLLQPENFLYSPALSRAYVLESTKAVYARIVIGDRLSELLAVALATKADSPEILLNHTLANAVRRMIVEDKDGAKVVDFMGPEVRRHFPSGDARDLAKRAWDYACRAETKFRSRGSYVIGAKYAWLVDYMRPRLSEWDVSA